MSHVELICERLSIAASARVLRVEGPSTMPRGNKSAGAPFPFVERLLERRPQTPSQHFVNNC